MPLSFYLHAAFPSLTRAPASHVDSRPSLSERIVSVTIPSCSSRSFVSDVYCLLKLRSSAPFEISFIWGCRFYGSGLHN